MKRQRMSKGPYVGVPKAIMGTAAWRTMSPEGRLLWIELRGWLRNDGLNNGKVHLSCRDAAEAIGLHKDTIAHRFVELEHFGFLRKTAEGFLGSDGRGIAAKYRFTDLAYGTHPPTRDYEKWDRTPFVYLPRRPGRKKQKPVLSRRTPRPTAQDIRKAGNGGAVCPTAQDIGAAPGCPTAPDISRLPYPAAAVGQDQGSSTARAPAVAHAAGGAGSSPAPDANLLAPRTNGARHQAVATEKQPDADVPDQAEPLASILPPPWEPSWDTEAARAAAEAYVPPSALANTEPAPPWVPYSERSREDHYAPEGLMDYVASVIDEQLRGLDEAKKVDLEADQDVSAPEPAPPPPYRPMLEGDRRREAIRARNQEALQRFDADMIRRAERAGVPVRQVQQDS